MAAVLPTPLPPKVLKPAARALRPAIHTLVRQDGVRAVRPRMQRGERLVARWSGCDRAYQAITCGVGLNASLTQGKVLARPWVCGWRHVRCADCCSFMLALGGCSSRFATHFIRYCGAPLFCDAAVDEPTGWVERASGSGV